MLTLCLHLVMGSTNLTRSWRSPVDEAVHGGPTPLEEWQECVTAGVTVSRDLPSSLGGLGVGDLLQPLADPDREGREEGPPEGRGAGPSGGVPAGAQSRHRARRLDEQRGEERLDGIKVLAVPDHRDEAEILGPHEAMSSTLLVTSRCHSRSCRPRAIG